MNDNNFTSVANSYDSVKDNLTPLVEVENIEDFEVDDTFSYEGFQVVRGEFFAHLFEPSVCFNNGRLYVNMACINKLPSVDYVQTLVNAKEKKLVIKPSTEDTKAAFQWCSYGRKDNKRKPKQVICRVFFHKIIDLMDWNPDFRYKILGKMIRANGEYLFAFDLNDAEVYQRFFKEGEKPKSSRTPVFPENWQNQFGLSYEEHRKSLQVNIFNGYTVFGVKNNDKAPNHSDGTTTENNEPPVETPISVDDTTSFNGGGYHGY